MSGGTNINEYKKSPKAPFIGSGHLSPEDEILRMLEKENKNLKEEINLSLFVTLENR